MSDLLILYICIFTFFVIFSFTCLFLLFLFSFFFFISVYVFILIIYLFIYFVVIVCYLYFSQNFYCHRISIFYLALPTWIFLLGFDFLDLSTGFVLGLSYYCIMCKYIVAIDRMQEFFISWWHRVGIHECLLILYIFLCT